MDKSFYDISHDSSYGQEAFRELVSKCLGNYGDVWGSAAYTSARLDYCHEGHDIGDWWNKTSGADRRRSGPQLQSDMTFQRRDGELVVAIHRGKHSTERQQGANLHPHTDVFRGTKQTGRPLDADVGGFSGDRSSDWESILGKPETYHDGVMNFHLAGQFDKLISRESKDSAGNSIPLWPSIKNGCDWIVLEQGVRYRVPPQSWAPKEWGPEWRKAIKMKETYLTEFKLSSILATLQQCYQVHRIASSSSDGEFPNGPSSLKITIPLRDCICLNARAPPRVVNKKDPEISVDFSVTQVETSQIEARE